MKASFIVNNVIHVMLHTQSWDFRVNLILCYVCLLIYISTYLPRHCYYYEFSLYVGINLIFTHIIFSLVGTIIMTHLILSSRLLTIIVVTVINDMYRIFYKVYKSDWKIIIVKHKLAIEVISTGIFLTNLLNIWLVD